jgi:CheY-like chemotaxis protein
MASGIAHDLNQQFALVSGYGELAMQALTVPEGDLREIDEALRIMTRAALDGGETVKRLLAFTRGREEGAPERVDVGALLRDVSLLTAPQWRDQAQSEGRHISLVVDAPSGLVVRAWPHALREALTNLVFNAVDALPHGGTITLRANAPEDRVVIEVADTGIGMPPEVRARLFEPFFTTKGESGTGLGLLGVFGTVERHRGEISVDSEVGQGTTVRVSLPAWRESEDDSSVPSLTTARRARQLRVLAVDDDRAIAEMVERALALVGHETHVTTSGEEALALLDTALAPIDVVVSDLGMGDGMSGWDLAAAVRQRWPQVRFVLATGWGAGIDPVEARARGVDAVMAKPYRVTELQRVVGSFA